MRKEGKESLILLVRNELIFSLHGRAAAFVQVSLMCLVDCNETIAEPVWMCHSICLYRELLRFVRKTGF
jgi:hypothetical protein